MNDLQRVLYQGYPLFVYLAGHSHILIGAFPLYTLRHGIAPPSPSFLAYSSQPSVALLPLPKNEKRDTGAYALPPKQRFASSRLPLVPCRAGSDRRSIRFRWPEITIRMSRRTRPNSSGRRFGGVQETLLHAVALRLVGEAFSLRSFSLGYEGRAPFVLACVLLAA